jgi:hypothetical protein
LTQFIADRIAKPLSLADTGFYVPSEKLGRIAETQVDSTTGKRSLTFDVTKRPNLMSGGAGMVSTASDYVRFAQMLLNGLPFHIDQQETYEAPVPFGRSVFGDGVSSCAANGASRIRGDGTVSVAEQTVFAEQASRDIGSFLRARAVELVPGGKLLLQVFGDVLNDAVLEVLNHGMIDRATCDAYYQPVYFRTLDELTEPVERYSW